MTDLCVSGTHYYVSTLGVSLVVRKDVIDVSNVMNSMTDGQLAAYNKDD